MLLCKLVHLLDSCVRREEFSAPQQKQESLFRLHGCQIQAVGPRPQRLAARGEEDGPRAGSRQEAIEQGQLFDIIYDQQPLAVCREPVMDRCDHTLLILFVSPGQLKYLGDTQQTGGHLLLSLCPNPEDGAIFQGIAVGILQGDLGFADATEPMQRRRLGQPDWMLIAQSGVQRLQYLLASGEVGITWQGNGPGWGERCEAGLEKLTGFLVIEL